MGPAEFIELIVTTRDALGGHVSNFTAALFAFLVMAYFVGGKLTLVQVWAISAIYSAYVFLPANAALQEIEMLGALMSQFRGQFPTEAAVYIPSGESYPIVFGTIALASWALSIAFLIQCRLGRAKDDAA